MQKFIIITAAVIIVFSAGACATADYDEGANYLSIMIDAASDGDTERGEEAEQLRKAKITGLALDNDDIDFDDLYLLAKIIHVEAGSSWLSDEHQMLVGNVLLNRVESPEFPDTIADCIYQKGQYYSAGSTYFKNIVPSKRAAENAARLLEGERVCPESVVFQANFRQGSGVYKSISDKYLGSTYFCHSNKMHLYEDEEAA